MFSGRRLALLLIQCDLGKVTIRPWHQPLSLKIAISLLETLKKAAGEAAPLSVEAFRPVALEQSAYFSETRGG